MKRLLILIVTASLTFTSFSHATAKRWDESTKEKKVHGQYTVQAMDKLVIENSYGKVHINTWDKNEITIDITVTAKGRSESDAQEILDRIDFIIDENTSHQILYRTVIGKSRNSNKKSEMTIDYTINTPKKNAIDITNKFGDVYLGDFYGKMEMNVSYGALDMQTITGPGKHVKVAFGNAIVSSIETGIFDVSYTNADINKAKDIEVTNRFGKLNIATVEALKIDQKYGNLEIGSVGQVNGDINYANLEIGNLFKKADLYLKYCGKADFKSVGADVDLVNVNAQYSNLFFGLTGGANLSIDIMTAYGNVTVDSHYKNIEITNSNRDGVGNSDHYKGKAGSGAGNMTIDTRYSNITFK